MQVRMRMGMRIRTLPGDAHMFPPSRVGIAAASTFVLG